MTAPELRNVLIVGGRTIHTAPAPATHGWEPGDRWWYGVVPHSTTSRRLREATVNDLDEYPRCRTCFPPQPREAAP